MATYVLVHGAWHGGWCWRKLVPLLRAEGHEVLTPTLTGLGERAHLANPDVSLDTHIQDLAGVLDSEELSDVILVGHSYAGLVITGAAARCPTRIARLVYLDAFVPDAGQSLMSFLPAPAADGMRQHAAEGWRIPPFTPERFGVTDPAEAEWLLRHLVTQPLRTFEQPVGDPRPAHIPCTYIYCTRHPMGTFDQFAARLRTDSAWRFHELDSGHDAMVAAPRELAALLLREA